MFIIAQKQFKTVQILAPKDLAILQEHVGILLITLCHRGPGRKSKDKIFTSYSNKDRFQPRRAKNLHHIHRQGVVNIYQAVQNICHELCVVHDLKRWHGPNKK